MNEVLGRVVDAMKAAHEQTPDDWEKIARDGIAALRDPLPREMTEAGRTLNHTTIATAPLGGGTAAAWRGMIDWILAK